MKPAVQFLKLVSDTAYFSLKTQKLNIQKVAELAGVSKATVSRVLNNYSYISDERREKVLKVIADTGYEPNQIARMLAYNRSNMIGLVIPSGAKFVFSDPYFPKLTEGISRAANQHRLILSLFLFDSLRDGIEAVRGIVTNRLFDGLLITGDRIDDEILPLLIDSEMPHVLMGRSLQHEAKINSVDVDNLQGGRIATEFLISRGYRRIGIVTCSHNIAALDRFNGYQQALADHGLPSDPSLVAYGDFSMESGASGMAALLPHNPDAVFVVSDTMALGALRTLREHAIRVPEDMAIVGFDDLPPAIQADPQLTTIRQPIPYQGQLAVETLMGMLASGGLPAQNIVLPTELVVRASTL
jgi:LacI family transcriptional regulator